MKNQTKILAEVVVSVALAYVLNLIVLFRLPQGGSVTAVSMVPILWLALRRGAKIGILTGVVFGLVDLFPQPFIVHPVQFLLDYPLAFGALGLAGLVRGHPIFGVVVGIGGRFVCHFLSGIIFFATYAPEGMTPVIYSAVYNGSYLVVEVAFSIIVMYALAKRGIINMYA
ncbi:MAG: energy-coupled thiamine transporter ThiT [archaeon]